MVKRARAARKLAGANESIERAGQTLTGGKLNFAATKLD